MQWCVLVASSVLLLVHVGAEEACPSSAASVSAGTCSLDGIAEDVLKLCPLANRSLPPLSEWGFRTLAASTGALRWVGLWPGKVSPANWADDYFVTNYIVVARILLGLYKTRTAAYVNVPSVQMKNTEDTVHVENIHVPHVDVDGSPNFYWFESFLPGILKRWFYVPLMTCFYSSLRRLGTSDNSLFGTFEDTLDDGTLNTWDVVLRSGDFESKRDWVMSFYDKAKSWDGKPLWPTQMTDFSAYKRRDIWDDRLEHVMAFHLIGSHRMQNGSWTFKNVGGSDSLTLPFRLPLNVFSSFAVREHFGRYGADLYFNEDGLPVLVQTPDGRLVSRGDREWQYWKFVWRSTLVTGVTLVDHLHLAHFRVGNLLARVIRSSLPPDNIARRLLSIFTFGSIFVNVQAVHQLVGPNHMLHRATPFKDFEKLSRIVPAGDSGILDDVPDAPGIRELANEASWKALHPRLRQMPFYADGRLLMEALRKLIVKFVRAWGGPEACLEDGSFSESMSLFIDEIRNVTREGNYKLDQRFARRQFNCSDWEKSASQRLITYLFAVTGYHRHVGFVGDYYSDPELASMSWKDGEAFGRPKQHMIMTVVNVFTSTRQPLLKEDFTHLFQGLSHQGEETTRMWREFQHDLDEVEKEVDRRNQNREIVNVNMSPRFVESGVSK